MQRERGHRPQPHHVSTQSLVFLLTRHSNSILAHITHVGLCCHSIPTCASLAGKACHAPNRTLYKSWGLMVTGPREEEPTCTPGGLCNALAQCQQDPTDSSGGAAELWLKVTAPEVVPFPVCVPEDATAIFLDGSLVHLQSQQGE